MNASAFPLRITLRVIHLAPRGSASSKKTSLPQVRDMTWQVFVSKTSHPRMRLRPPDQERAAG